MRRLESHPRLAGAEEILHLLQGLLPSSALATGSGPLQSVAEALALRGARCAIIQRDVQDPDFIAEHTAYYSKWTKPIPRFCTRLHFFSEESSSDDPLELIDESSSTDGSSYIGFATLRPIAVAPVAATIISTAVPSVRFITSQDTFQVNLAGRRFEVDGTPFIQQDNAVGACAQASIWMALRTLRRKEGRAAYDVAKITTAATRFVVNGRTLPNRSGLRLEQISEAIRAAGYSPHTVPLVLRERISDGIQPASDGDLRRAKEALYPYVESGIPALLALFPPGGEGHAVLSIGHNWDEDPSIDDSDKIDSVGRIRMFDASLWTSSYVIHNDNTGPYMDLPSKGEAYSLENALQAIPFLPPDVFVDGNEARLCCLRVLKEVFMGGAGDGAGFPLDLVVRVYLQDRSDFRSDVVSSSMSGEVKKYYREKWLPRRVWVMEVNARDGYGQTPAGNTERLGEILLDPTVEPNEGHFLAVHLTPRLLEAARLGSGGTGVIINRDAFTGEIDSIPVLHEFYNPRLRGYGPAADS